MIDWIAFSKAKGAKAPKPGKPYLLRADLVGPTYDVGFYEGKRPDGSDWWILARIHIPVSAFTHWAEINEPGKNSAMQDEGPKDQEKPEVAANAAAVAMATFRLDLEQHLFRQREFSSKTFGPGSRRRGIIDHINKELREVEARPRDVMEWADIILLALDGAWRSGILLPTIVARIEELKGRRDVIKYIRTALSAAEAGHAMAWTDIVNLAVNGAQDRGWPPEATWLCVFAKQIKNESREWPDWRTSSPDHAIEHIKADDAEKGVQS